MGICICFDCRFPEYVRLMALEGKVILVPAAFNAIQDRRTGVMLRSRGMDNQCFIMATSVQDETSGYISWGIP